MLYLEDIVSHKQRQIHLLRVHLSTKQCVHVVEDF